MSLSKQDYELIARAISSAVRPNMLFGEKKLLYALAMNLSERFQSANPRFSPAMFIQACKLPTLE